MKLFKTLALGALALAAASVASATNVKVTGSSAFRKAVYAAVINRLGSGTVKAAYIGTALSGANQATFSNGTDSVQCCFAGSVGGVAWIINDTNVATAPGGDTSKAWITVAKANAGATASIGAGTGFTITGGQSYADTAAVTTAGGWDSASVADFTMSDSLQDSTPYDSVSTGLALTSGATDSGSIGVVQFLFCKGVQQTGSTYNWTGFTNMTALGFQSLAANGNLKLSFFTGIAADSTTNVVLVGRDNDSGTRLATTFETGLGSVDTAMSQYKAFDASSNDVGTVTGAGAITTLTLQGSLGGYVSGGHVKAVLNSAVDTATRVGAKPVLLVGYVGSGDKPTNTAQFLTYNGVAQSDAATKTGQYSFWTYEQSYYKTTDAAKITVINGLSDSIQSTYATAAGGVTIASMLASRTTEGSVISAN